MKGASGGRGAGNGFGRGVAGRADQMARYDRLPPEVRAWVQSAPYPIDVRDVEWFVITVSDLGGSARNVVEALQQALADSVAENSAGD